MVQVDCTMCKAFNHALVKCIALEITENKKKDMMLNGKCFLSRKRELDQDFHQRSQLLSGVRLASNAMQVSLGRKRWLR